MGRPRKASQKLASVQECAAAMDGLLSATVQFESLIADRDLAIAKVQAAYAPSIDEMRGRARGLEAALQDYYYAHIPEIEKDGVKHLDLGNGRIGRRTNPERIAPLNRSWTWERITDLAQVIYKTAYLLLPKPKLDLDKLKAELTIEELKQIGLKVEQGETFYAEPARLPVPEAKA